MFRYAREGMAVSRNPIFKDYLDPGLRIAGVTGPALRCLAGFSLPFPQASGGAP